MSSYDDKTTGLDGDEAPGALGGAHAGLLIGDYRLIRKLGQGGMGQVWLAEELSLSRQVALKLLNPGRTTERALSFFARESRAGGRLSHPGLVAVYAAGEVGGVHYIAQELVAGGHTLADQLEAERLAAEPRPDHYADTARLFVEIADALQAAHDAHVIHRDVKPQNILMTADGRPKVTDFGLARITDEVSLTHVGEAAGTYAYMSPEQVTLKHIGIDHRTDVFSLGVVLYEALALTRPFQGETSQAIAQTILFDDPPDASRVHPGVPAELAVICAKAIEKKPADRYQSMRELADDLRRHLAHEPILARPPGRLRRVQKWVVRHPTTSAAAGVGLVALLAVTWLLVDLAGKSESLARETSGAEVKLYTSNLLAAEGAEDDGATLRFLAACPEHLRGWEWEHLNLKPYADPATATLEGHTGPVSVVVFSPDGARVVSAGDATPRLWDGMTGEPLAALEGHTGDVRAMAFGADGTRLVSASSDGTLRLWDGVTGEARATLSGHGGEVLAVVFSEDGTHIASASTDGTVRLWDGATGELVKTLEGHTGPVRALAFGSGAARLVSASDDATLRLWDVATGERTALLTGHEGPVTHVAYSPGGERLASGGADATVRLWDGVTGEALATLEGHEGPMSALAFGADGTRLVSASQRAPPIPFAGSTADAQKEARKLVPQGPFIVDVTGTEMYIHRLAAGTTLRLWDGVTGEQRATLAGHGLSYPRAAAFSPDGQRLVSGAPDSTLRVWSGTTDDPLVTFKNPGGVRALAFSPDGKRLVVGSQDGTLHLWHSDLEQARAMWAYRSR